MDNGVNITSTAGYMALDSWILANIIQLETMDFCLNFLNRNNDPAGRMFDQMTQAARSCQANIAEGSARHQTSVETELRLLDVARASLSELAGDYMFILMMRGESSWEYEDERRQRVQYFNLDKPEYSVDILPCAMKHIMAQRNRYCAVLGGEDISTRANGLLILCSRVIKMLQKQIEARFEKFKQEGGFAENMTLERLRAKAATADDSPRCPKCGGVMVRRITQRGSRQGQSFWGCANYPHCDGIVNI